LTFEVKSRRAPFRYTEHAKVRAGLPPPAPRSQGEAGNCARIGRKFAGRATMARLKPAWIREPGPAIPGSRSHPSPQPHRPGARLSTRAPGLRLL